MVSFTNFAKQNGHRTYIKPEIDFDGWQLTHFRSWFLGKIYPADTWWKDGFSTVKKHNNDTFSFFSAHVAFSDINGWTSSSKGSIEFTGYLNGAEKYKKTFELNEDPRGAYADFQEIILNFQDIDKLKIYTEETVLFSTMTMGVNHAPIITSQDNISVTEDTESSAFTFSASDKEDDDITFSFSSPSKGTIKNNNNGTYTYLPSKDAVGKDSFFIISNDKINETKKNITVDISPINDAPTNLALNSNTLVENVTGAIIGSLSANDVDGDNLTYSFGGNNVDFANKFFEIKGSILKLKDAYSYDFETSISPTLTIIATDGKEITSLTQKLQILNANDTPYFISNPKLTAIEDQEYSYTIQTKDQDGDNLKISVQTLPWLSLKDNGNTTATLTGTPNDYWAHTFSKTPVILTVTDKNEVSSTQEFFITINQIDNDPKPTIKNLGLKDNVILDVLQTGSKWNFPNQIDKVLNWSLVDGTIKWTDKINILNTQQSINVSKVISYIEYCLNQISKFIDLDFNYIGKFSNYNKANISGSDINIVLDDGQVTGDLVGIGIPPSLESTIVKDDYYSAGDIYLNINKSDLGGFYLNHSLLDSFSKFILLHEIGHAIGLKHPHDKGVWGNRPTFSENGIQNYDSANFTIMSYSPINDPDPKFPLSPMIADVIALQNMYGARPSNKLSNEIKGDTTYDILSLLSANNFILDYDISGEDKFSGSQSNEGLLIKRNDFLPEYPSTNFTHVSFLNEVNNQKQISKFYGIVGEIENIEGSQFADKIFDGPLDSTDWTIKALGGDDQIYYSGGSETIDGGEGNDTINFTKNSFDQISEINLTNGKYEIKFPDFALNVLNIEFLNDAKGIQKKIADAYLMYKPNQKPVIISKPIKKEISENADFTYTLKATDTDQGDTITLETVTLPSWLSFDAKTGVLSGKPSNSDVGTHQVKLKVTDNNGASVEQAFKIEVNNTNDAPSITSSPITAIKEDVNYSYTLKATDPDQGDAITLETVTLPSWLSFDAKTGVLSGKPSNSDVGTHQVKLKVTDNNGSITYQDFNISVSSIPLDTNLGDDIIIGGDGLDIIIGGDGDDNLDGGSGDDLIMGGSGNDIIKGGTGKDFLLGGSGNDTFKLTPDGIWQENFFCANICSHSITLSKVPIEGKNKYEDVFYGGGNDSPGADRIELSEGDDVFALDDAFSGFNSAVSLQEDNNGKSNAARISEIEIIDGKNGHDIIDLTSTNYQLSENISIKGGSGNDIIWGTSGDNTLDGGDGDDVLFGGQGFDSLTGGNGADTFEFCNQSENNIIKDYNKANGDKLAFYIQSGDKQSVSFSGDTVAWGSLQIQLEGLTISSANDVLVVYNAVA